MGKGTRTSSSLTQQHSCSGKLWHTTSRRGASNRLALAQEALATNPRIKAILFECTELPCYSNLFRLHLKMPVYDIVTCLDYFHSSSEMNMRTLINPE